MNAEGLMENSGGRGLPEKLPEGERVLWQGKPAWKILFRHAFHAGYVAAYFAAIIAWCVFSSWHRGTPAAALLVSLGKMMGLAVAPIALTALYCWALERSTVYTITNRRVVMSFGLAVPMSLNLPFSRIESVGLSHHAQGSGDLALRLVAGERLAYLLAWPHARPWRMARAEPMLRCIEQVDAAAAVLARALSVETALTLVASQRMAPARRDLAAQAA